eukprot:854805-Pelagomonas_calceolata.AAC.2
MTSFEESFSKMNDNVLVHVYSNLANQYQQLQQSEEGAEEAVEKEAATTPVSPVTPTYKKALFALLCLLALCGGALAGELTYDLYVHRWMCCRSENS